MRHLTSEIVRFFSEEARMAFVAGPRQVGKTTLVKHLLAQAGMEAFYFISKHNNNGSRSGRTTPSF